MMTYFIEHSLNLRQQVGSSYEWMIVISFLVGTLMWRWYRKDSKPITATWLYVGSVALVLISPISYVMSRILQMGQKQLYAIFNLLPSIAMAAIVLAMCLGVLEKKIGRWKSIIILLLVIVICAGTPWTYSVNNFQIRRWSSAKVSEDIENISNMMVQGKAAVPDKVRGQLREVNRNIVFTEQQPDEKNLADILKVVKEEDCDYMVVRKEYDNIEWLAFEAFSKVGETERYVVYACP